MSDTNFSTRGVENLSGLAQLNRYLRGHKGFIAGGVFKNILSGQPIRDVDVFFHSEQDWERADRKFAKKHKLAYENDKVRAFVVDGVRVELIRHTFGTPDDIISGFDFTVTKFAYYKTADANGDDVFRAVHHADYFEHLFMRRLVIDDRLVKPLSTFERTYKYNAYGFRLCKESKATLLAAIQALGVLDESDPSASLYDGMD